MDSASLVSRFNSGYAMAGQTRRHRLFAEALGIPIEVEPNSFVTMELFTRVARELRVGPGDRLVDLACGRGGPGLLLARLTGADLVGVDFSEVAIAHARQRTPLFVPAGRAAFHVGELAATGLDSGCADAVVCIDSVQFAPTVTRPFARPTGPAPRRPVCADGRSGHRGVSRGAGHGPG